MLQKCDTHHLWSSRLMLIDFVDLLEILIMIMMLNLVMPQVLYSKLKAGFQETCLSCAECAIDTSNFG